MAKITVQDNRLTVKEGLLNKTVIHLDRLRLVYLYLPETLKNWFVVSSSSGIEGYDLDLVTDDNIEDLSRKFDDMIRQERAGKLYGLKLVLADYDGQSVIIPIKNIKSSNIDIFAALLRFRSQRLATLRAWLASSPEVYLKGLMGQHAILGKNGFKRGKKVLPWADVGNLQINTVNMVTHLLVIPKGVSTGYFSFKKHHYSLCISLKKKEFFIAECDFWISRINESGNTMQQDGSIGGTDQEEQSSAPGESFKNTGTVKRMIEPGFKGWLWLPILALVAQPLSFLKAIPGFFKAANPFALSLNVYVFLYDLVLVALTLHLSYFFFKKKSITPVYFIFYRVAIFLPWLFIFFLSEGVPLTASSQANITQPMLAHTFGLMVMVPYFVYSRRVKVTFTEPLNPEIGLEKMMIPLQPFFDKTARFFHKTRKFIIPITIAFIIVSFFLAIVITSL